MPQPLVPKGIMLLASVCFLTAGSFLLIGGLFAVAPATLSPFGFRPNPETSVRLAGLGFFGGVGLLAGAVGYGLWRLKRWAHFIIVSFSASSTLVRVISFLMNGVGNSTPNAALLRGAAVVLLLGVLWYLWTDGVRAAFGVLRKGGAVGTALQTRSSCPPHRSQRAALPHWALTSGTSVKALRRPRV